MRGSSGVRPSGTAPAAPVYSFAKRSDEPQRAPVSRKKKVLFVCIGNAARSQMAEGFARAYGSDVIAAQSAGTAPATMLAPFAVELLQEKNIDLSTHFPKGLDMLRDDFDIIVNLSGRPLSITAPRMLEWSVADPAGQREEAYRSAAAQIEDLVIRLIIELRTL